MSGKTTHFVGIGGIGMSAIAQILLARGEAVSGSDSSDSPALRTLAAVGAHVHVGHAAANVNGARAVVVSSAIDELNPEVAAARERGIPVMRRGDMLAQLVNARRGIAVCGTHGKTTTTAMTAAVLRAGKVDASLVLGGIDRQTESNAHDGAEAWFLTEADESDGSFALLQPEIAVVTNIENDHLSNDAELPALVESFAGFFDRLPEGGTAIVGCDNAQSAALAARSRRASTTTFGFAPGAGVRASGVRYANLGSTFDAIVGGQCLGSVALQVPGAINVQNALGAIAVGRALEIPFVRIARGLHGFRGVHRRFEILVRSERMTVVDDYAHHPTAVAATIAAARAYHRGPLVVAFQPHRYTRTAHLAADFARALRGADAVYLAPIYAAFELPIAGVDERSIGEPLARSGARVTYVAQVGDLATRLAREAPLGALVLMLGAGDITAVAARLAADITACAAS